MDILRSSSDLSQRAWIPLSILLLSYPTSLFPLLSPATPPSSSLFLGIFPSVRFDEAI